jgi:hypothetical protein
MVQLKSIAKQPRGRLRVRWLVALVPLALVLAGGVERWHGRSALSRWKHDMESRGEVFEAERLWPAPSPVRTGFSNRLARAVRQLPKALEGYAGRVSGIIPGQPGESYRGSQQARPQMEREDSASWQELNAAVRQAQPALESLRNLMKNPAHDMGYSIKEQVENGSMPSFENVRRGAQALHAATMNDLHEDNLAEALENLSALSGFARVYEDDPTLACFMMRVAVSNLRVDLCWDGLQAQGWTESQLAALQQAMQNDGLGVEQMPRAMQGEMIARLDELDWFRSHSYEAWLVRYQRLCERWDSPVLARTMRATGPLRLWREVGFHPLWRFAWADQDELDYLRSAEKEVAILRAVPHHHSWIKLREQLETLYRAYRPPMAAWRFYRVLPFADECSGIIGDPDLIASAYPFPDFSYAWFLAMKNLTLREMVITAIALERYELRHGQLPDRLASLVPEFLPELPEDLMEGQPLQYHLRPHNSFTLYSVGEDGLDEGGDARPAAPRRRWPAGDRWDGRDWVWPQAAPFS